MKLFLILAFVIIFFNSCEKKREIKVIENIELGIPTDAFFKQMDSLNLHSEVFFSKPFFISEDDLNNYIIKFYVTDIFDFKESSANGSQNLGIIYPEKYQGSDYVIGLYILMGHTDRANLISDAGFSNLTNYYGIRAFVQDIDIFLLEQIEIMLTEKYGTPIEKDYKSIFNPVLVIDKNEIKIYSGTEINMATITEWENEYVRVILNKGLESYNIFTPAGYTYTIYGEEIPSIDYTKGERPMRSYVYIKYEIKPDIIEKMGYNKTKL